MMTTVSLLDPLADARWDDVLERNPRATVFHSRGWLEALKRTYGYEPIVLTTTSRGSLKSGLVLCRIRTLMSRRLVSLPFSDHLEPLVDSSNDLPAMLEFLAAGIREGRWSSFELRPRSLRIDGPGSGTSYYLHTLDLRRSTEEIFDAFHPSSTKRAIRRAEREGVDYESGMSQRLLSSFYDLLRMSRRRHGVPPQPIAWFRNLVGCLRDSVTIHVARKDAAPIAGMLTLSFRKTMVYKYGGSDARQHRLGGMPYLFWRAIQDAKVHGIEELDLGRSDLDQAGLVRFKDHLGATRSMLTYYTSPQRRAVHERPMSRAVRRLVVDRLPDAALDLAGRLLYKHLG